MLEVDALPERGHLAAGLIADAAGGLSVWRRAGFAARIG